MKYKCLLFDLDGTLASADNALFHIVNDALAENNFPSISPNTLSKFVGKAFVDIYKVHSDGSTETVKKLESSHLKSQVKHFDKYVLYPNVNVTLQKIAKKGYKMGLVTTANKPKVEHLLKSLKLADYFGVVVTAQDVSNYKPHPEPILKAMERLSADKRSTIMIGDSDADILSAQSAGLDSVGVMYSSFGKRVKEYNPTYTVDSFEKILQIIE